MMRGERRRKRYRRLRGANRLRQTGTSRKDFVLCGTWVAHVLSQSCPNRLVWGSIIIPVIIFHLSVLFSIIIYPQVCYLGLLTVKRTPIQNLYKDNKVYEDWRQHAKLQIDELLTYFIIRLNVLLVKYDSTAIIFFFIFFLLSIFCTQKWACGEHAVKFSKSLNCRMFFFKLLKGR